MLTFEGRPGRQTKRTDPPTDRPTHRPTCGGGEHNRTQHKTNPTPPGAAQRNPTLRKAMTDELTSGAHLKINLVHFFHFLPWCDLKRNTRLCVFGSELFGFLCLSPKYIFNVHFSETEAGGG